SKAIYSFLVGILGKAPSTAAWMFSFVVYNAELMALTLFSLIHIWCGKETCGKKERNIVSWYTDGSFHSLLAINLNTILLLSLEIGMTTKSAVRLRWMTSSFFKEVIQLPHHVAQKSSMISFLSR